MFRNLSDINFIYYESFSFLNRSFSLSLSLCVVHFSKKTSCIFFLFATYPYHFRYPSVFLVFLIPSLVILALVILVLVILVLGYPCSSRPSFLAILVGVSFISVVVFVLLFFLSRLNSSCRDQLQKIETSDKYPYYLLTYFPDLGEKLIESSSLITTTHCHIYYYYCYWHHHLPSLKPTTHPHYLFILPTTNNIQPNHHPFSIFLQILSDVL